MTYFFLCKQKTAYEMRISDWSSDVCSSDLVLVLALADNRCDALEGFYVGDKYVPFAGDGAVAGYNGQLSVWWRPGTENQTVPAVLTANGPGWTDRKSTRLTPVTNAHLVCRLLLEKKKITQHIRHTTDQHRQSH